MCLTLRCRQEQVKVRAEHIQTTLRTMPSVDQLAQKITDEHGKLYTFIFNFCCFILYYCNFQQYSTCGKSLSCSTRQQSKLFTCFQNNIEAAEMLSYIAVYYILTLCVC